MSGEGEERRLRVGLSCLGAGLGGTGGVEVYRRELTRALRLYDRSGAEYTLLCGPGDEAGIRPPEPRFRSVHLRARGAWPEPAWRRRLRIATAPLGAWVEIPFSRDVDRLRLDAVHFPATRFDQIDLRTPAVLTFFDMQEELLPRHFPWRERLARRIAHRRAVRRAFLVLAPSAFTARCLQRVYGTPIGKILTLPVGIPDRFFSDPQPGEQERLAARHGVPPGRYVLFPANPWPHKNHPRLFSALRELRVDEGQPPVVACCGALPGERRSIRALAAEAGFPPDRLRELGFVAEQDLPALYRAARLLAFPSLFEGFGMPVAEALASGCPVACSDATALPELAGDAARYFDPRSEAQMRAAVRELWEDAALRARLAERGRERARDLRWERIVPGVVEAYRVAAGASPSRRSKPSGSGSSASASEAPAALSSGTE